MVETPGNFILYLPSNWQKVDSGSASMQACGLSKVVLKKFKLYKSFGENSYGLIVKSSNKPAAL